MREETPLFIIRIINNALLAYVAAAAIRILFLPETPVFEAHDLLVSAYVICVTVLDRIRPGFFLSLLSLTVMLLCVYTVAGRYQGIPGVIRIILCIISVVISIAARIADQPLFTPELPEFLVFLPLYFVSFAINRDSFRPLAFAGEAVFAVLCVLNAGISNMYRSLIGFHQRAAVPYGAIKRAGAGLLAICTGITLLITLISGSVTFGPALWSLVKRAVLGLLRAIFSLFPDEEAAEEVVLPDPEPVAQSQPFAIPDEAPTDPRLTALWNAIFYIMSFLAFTIIIYLLFRWVRDMIRRFRAGGRNRNRIRDYTLPGERREKLVPLSDDRTDRGPGLSLSPSARIRRLYIRTIRDLPGASDIRPSQTPRELEITARGVSRSPLLSSAGGIFRDSDRSGGVLTGLKDRDTASDTVSGNIAYPLPEEIRSLYEKARYAPYGCTADDVRAMKNHIRRL